MGASGSRGLLATGSPCMYAQSLDQQCPWARHRLTVYSCAPETHNPEKKINRSEIMENN